MNIGKKVAAVVATTICFAGSGTTAVHATETSSPSTTPSPSPNAQCAAVHLVLVNGTFDTSAQQDSTVDHGFGAQIAGPAMRSANDGPVKDPSAGISVEKALDDVTTSASATPSTTSESVGDLDSYQDQLWGSAPSSSALASDVWTTTEAAPVDEAGMKVARTYITYPAAAGGAFIPGLPTSEAVPYEESMTEGAINTAAVIQEIDETCSETKIFLAGHSQGAQVASTVAREIGSGATSINPDKIAGVALFSDPTRARGAATVENTGQQPAPVPGTTGTNVASVGSFTSPDQKELDGGGIGVDATGGKDFGALANRTASWCAPGDLVCDLPISGPLSELVVSTAQQLDLSDPEKSLQIIADSLSPSVVMGGVNELPSQEFSYGNGGFSASASNGRDTKQPLISQIAMDGATEAQTVLGDQFISDLGKSVVGGLSQLGGMALGTGMTILKEAVTVENIAQVALAGVAGPQAAMTAAVARLSEAAVKVVTPELAVGAAETVLNEVNILGVSPKGLSEVVVEAAGHGAAHNSYGSQVSTTDGRSAIDATVDWIVAASYDVSGESTPPPLTSSSTSALASLSFDTESAQSALAEVASWRALQGEGK